MRVLHVSAYFAPAFGFGGPPRSLLTLCRAQRQAGLTIEVITTTANRGLPLPAHPNGVDLDGLLVRYFPLSAPHVMLGATSMAPALDEAVRRAAVVHLHGLFNRTIWMGSAAARAAFAPTVVSPRGMLEAPALDHHRWRKQLSWALFDRRALAGAACWHATSRGEADTLRGRAGSSHRVVEIPNAVEPVDADPDAQASARAFAQVPPGAPYVLFLGRVHPIKRLDRLAAAFVRLQSRLPDVHLVIAGPDERGYRASVEPAFASVAHVHWCGEVGGAPKAGLIAGAAALVLCSDSESFGMSVAEALAAGVPAVVTQTCPWSVLDTSRCGFWVAPSPPAIADALHRVLSDPAEARAMGARGRDLASREWAPSAVAMRWIALYSELARTSRAPSPASA